MGSKQNTFITLCAECLQMHQHIGDLFSKHFLNTDKERRNVFPKVRKVDRWCTPNIVSQYLRNVSNQPMNELYRDIKINNLS